MPQFDGTGPAGRGPRSGRGLGRCDKAMACSCPFITVQDDSLQTLTAKEHLLQEMLAAVRAEKSRKTS